MCTKSNSFTLAAFVCLTAVSVGRAERLFVAMVEADNYLSAIYGMSAFCRSAELPIKPESVELRLASMLALPSFSGVSSREPLRFVQTVDPALPLSDDNPALVALIPLADTGATVQHFFNEAYGSSTPLENYTLFENPSSTNLAPRVAAALSGKHLLASRSPEALDWTWANRASLIGAPSQSSSGTFRALVNPQRMADLSGKYTVFSETIFNADRFLKDFETLMIEVALDGQALDITLRGTPKPDTPLDKIAALRLLPDRPLWNAIPENAFYASVTASGPDRHWNAYRGSAELPLLNPARSMLPPQAFSGDRVLYLAPTKSRRGLCLVQIETVKDREAVKQTIKKLHTAPREDGIVLRRGSPRQSAGLEIETYSIALPSVAQANGTNAVSSASMLNTILSLFLKHAALETALVKDNLITVVGPPQALSQELPSDLFASTPVPLHRKLQAQNTAMSAEEIAAGGVFRASALLRHIVTMMPDIKPDQARRFPVGGDGASLGICISPQRGLTVSARFAANEIAALQRANRDGRQILQELLFQMFARQMLETPQP
ncbi:MAG: hypothetical protein PHU80_04350 [Kiritimatiellae bacterium]|nr:hypothetical protein [Kiritimatiellia bacterium]